MNRKEIQTAIKEQLEIIADRALDIEVCKEEISRLTDKLCRKKRTAVSLDNEIRYPVSIEITKQLKA